MKARPLPWVVEPDSQIAVPAGNGRLAKGTVTDGVRQDERVFLSMLPAGQGESRLAVAVVLLSLVAFAAAAPFARVQLARVDAFIPAYQAALAISDLITAVLLFGQFSILRSPGLRLLASGYLFTALMVIVHTLSFPGLFSPNGLLGAGPQTTAWLYMFWHGGFPAFVLGHAWFRKADSRADGLPCAVGKAILSSIAGVVAAVIVLTLLVTTWQAHLPPIMDGNHYTPIMSGVVSTVWLLSLAALVALWMRRPHSVLNVWLMVVMCAWLFDVALSAVLNAGRFDLGFYAGRIYGLLAASFVLLVLLLETRALYARLAKSLEAERIAAEQRAQDLQDVNRALQRSEDQLQQLNEGLEQRVIERTAQIEDTNRQLQAQIDERWKAQLQLRASETRHREVVELIREAIWIHNDGRIVFANPQAAEMFGVERPEDLVGRAVIELVHPEDRENAAARTRKLLEDHEAVPIANMRLLRSDGSEIFAETQAVPFRHLGKPSVLAVARDVTAQRSAEMRLQQAQKMEAVGQLTGGIAHDFNNLLAVIIGNLQLLQKPLRDNSRFQGRLDLALEAARSGAELTRRLLAFSRRQVLAPKIVQPNGLLLQMVPLMERSLGEAVTLHVQLADDLWSIKVDTSNLESAILNLAINARDAMPEGGRISIVSANVTLDAAYAVTHPYVRPGPHVMIAVTDTGIGMTPEVMKCAFEPFFTTKETGKGSGLGLSMVYGFVKQSGGHIELYSEIGHGTTVKIYLPRAEGTADQATEPPSKSREQPTGSEKILVVDDNAGVRTTAVSMLETLGYEVLEAEDGVAALTVLAGSPDIDMVFSDIVMSGKIDGFMLADEVRKRFPRTRVLLTSGFADIPSRSMPTIEQDLAWIGKPYECGALAHKVREVLTPVGDAT